ncbi:MAG: prephenate dehydrogenase/arogenate dehydrogenase family protein [Chloroflexi bacterium]|nr:prephenate dehydrogenase/arogenate dehydrogenase family protein [Chloroflexota bacterium]
MNIGIIGYGRFGRFWADVLKEAHTITVADVVPVEPAPGVTAATVEAICAEADTIFLCVPINAVRETAERIAALLQPGTAVLDTCSVKVQPANVMLETLAPCEGIDLIATHPMFGPDSGAHGLEGLPVVMHPLRRTNGAYSEWRDIFTAMGLSVVEMTPDEHDHMAAYSQGITHYIGRILGELDLQETPIDTSGYMLLRHVVEQTCNDSWELFTDLQQSNPYTGEMRIRLERALDAVYSQLLPPRADPETVLIGLQGGQGSFNEEACRAYCQANDIEPFRMMYLYTTDKVLDALHRGEIDHGIFALQNARGGIVRETIDSLSRQRCQVEAFFDIVLSHCIMHHPEVDFREVTTIISHPQAFAQCTNTLQERYGHIPLTVGQGDMIDQALCARHIADGILPPTTAVLAPRVCAELYGLTIHDEGLQDLGSDNLTTFVWASRHDFR